MANASKNLYLVSRVTVRVPNTGNSRRGITLALSRWPKLTTVSVARNDEGDLLYEPLCNNSFIVQSPKHAKYWGMNAFISNYYKSIIKNSIQIYPK